MWNVCVSTNNASTKLKLVSQVDRSAACGGAYVEGGVGAGGVAGGELDASGEVAVPVRVLRLETTTCTHALFIRKNDQIRELFSGNKQLKKTSARSLISQ
jgi:hypothetical protein